MAWRSAIATACVRVSACSFEITRFVSDLTVSTLRPIRRATSSVWKPSASSWRISRSRSDSGWGGAGAAGEQLEDLALALGQRLVAVGAVGHQQRGGQRRVNERLAAGDGADRAQQVLR